MKRPYFKLTLLLTLVLAACFALACAADNKPPAKENLDKPEATKKILIVTGIDYPGHKWKLTTPVLKKAIAKDKRLNVTVVEDPKFLASPDLNKYDAVVLHFMDWEVPDPGPKARANLKAFVEKGKGMVIVHFACGAFQDWPEFKNLAGRAWDPKLRGHDPYGKFKVEIIDTKHPITKGLKPFETTDEMYTCLAGDRPIKVLAKSKSKVDGKDYPMAFVFNYGKGRVFHSPLGHDVKAFTNAGCQELFRRGTAWAAGLEPVRPKKVVLIAGPNSHGAGTHSHIEGVQLLKHCIETSPNTPPIEVETILGDWPDDMGILDDADSILIFSDGDGRHPLAKADRMEKIRALMKRRVGLALIHYAVTPPNGKQVGPSFLEWIGGYYENGYSRNPINEPRLEQGAAAHPICRGWGDYSAKDEFYYRIRFGDNDKRLTPILTAMLPKDNPERQVLAWAVQRADGGRGFGFTGGHYHENWKIEPFRKMVLNAILWTADIPVPENGVE